MYKKLYLLISFVLVLTLASTSYGTDPGTIKLDLNNTEDNNDANTHAGFTKFSIADSGSEVNGIVIDLGGTIDSRLRVDPNGRAFDDVYRDFVFGLAPSGVTITLWGLGVNQDCNITMWSYDHQSEPNRLADWAATWGDACDANYMFTTEFSGGEANWPAGDGSTNYFGTAKADYLGRIIMTSTIGPNSPATEPFAFVNALIVEPKGAFVATNYAHRPQPVDGAEYVPIDSNLSWRPGGLASVHDIYLGTNFEEVNSASRVFPLGVLASQGQGSNTYDPSGDFELEAGDTYYWRVDEVNDTNIWKGDVWSFNTFTTNFPIAWWKFDEGSGSIAYDSSGNNYHADINGNPVWRTGSPYGGSGYLDLDGDGDFTDANYLDNNDIELVDYTVTLWFKSEGGTQNRDIFSAYGYNLGHGILLELRGSEGGRIRYIHRSPVQGTGTYNEDLYTITPPSYDDNVWHHLAVVRSTQDESTGRYIYIDGEEVSDEDEGDPRPSFDLPLMVVCGALRPENRYWVGGIDDVRIYNGVLTPTQIREVMRSPIASAPNPSNGATDVEFTPTLSWLSGLYAADVNGHRVYFDPVEENVEMRSGCQINGVVTTDPCYGPIGPLEVGQTYYWAVDEVNDACVPYQWKGDIWHFTTRDYLTVEDFDSYTDNDDLWETWKDYWDNMTRAQVSVETILVRDGNSMRYNYLNDSSPHYAEATATTAALGFDQDWLSTGSKALAIWFYGTTGNDCNEGMYIVLSDGDGNSWSMPYNGDMNDLAKAEWQEWNVALQDFVDGNDVNLANVASITLGFGDGIAPGGTGDVYFEDIFLYASKCVLSERDPNFALVDFAPAGYSASGDCKVDYEELTILADDWLAKDYVVATTDPNLVGGLVAYYPLDEGTGTTTEDVAGDHNGTLADDVSWIKPGLIGNSAIHVPFVEGSRVDIGTWNPVGNWDPCDQTGELTLAIWAKWAGPTGVSQGLICKRDLQWDVNGLMFGFEISDWPFTGNNQLVFRGYKSDHSEPNDPNEVSSADVTMDNFLGKWTHLAATVDGNFTTIYINGKDVNSDAVKFGPNSVDSNAASMAIGNATGVNGEGHTWTFNGDLDEARIYNRALTAAEVAYLADLTLGDGELHIPVPSHAEVYEGEPEGQRYVNFRDFALIANVWLKEEHWP